MTDPAATPPKLIRPRRDLSLSLTLLGVNVVYVIWPINIIPALAALKSGFSYRRLKKKRASAEKQKD